METIILTSRNCHRASTVMNIEHPEWGEYVFQWRGHREDVNMFHSNFYHVLTRSYERIELTDCNSAMKDWRVTGWRYALNLEDLWEKAVRAFEGTSHSPEERAGYYIRAYETTLLEDLEKLPKEENETYIEQYRQWVINVFDKHSRVLSAMITGPARFPTSRNEKASNAYDKAVSDFVEWRKKYSKRVERKLEEAKSPEQRTDEEWEALKKDIRYNAKVCAEIDNGAKGSYRTAFTNSIFGKVERLANNGKSDLVLRALDYIRELQEGDHGLKKPLFTTRHKIWTLREVCEKAIETQKERESKEDSEVVFDGGRIVKNYSKERLQIYHDEKPSAQVIAALKANGFKWSRLNGCWQRQLTNNAYYGAARVFYGSELTEERQSFINKLVKA